MQPQIAMNIHPAQTAAVLEWDLLSARSLSVFSLLLISLAQLLGLILS